MMTFSVFSPIKAYFRWSNQRLFGTPERALNQAYDAALQIKALENEHFNGQKICLDNGQYSQSILSHFQAKLQKNLLIAKLKVAEFNVSASLLGYQPNPPVSETHIQKNGRTPTILGNTAESYTQTILEKLAFIDAVLERYGSEKIADSPAVAAHQDTDQSSATSASLVSFFPKSVPSGGEITTTTASDNPDVSNRTQISLKLEQASKAAKKKGTVTNQTSFLPRSILRTIDRLKRELDPKAEEEVVSNFRNSKTKTILSLKFILLIILIPLLTQQISKNFVIGPFVEQVRGHSEQIFLNLDMEEEAFLELERFKEKLNFRILIGEMPKISPAEVEEEVKEKAVEIAKEFRDRSTNAIKNVFADLLSFVAFGIVVVNSKREISVLKSFMDDIVYGLSDSAKAFIIILFTDIFVGFHSPHGWEVILEGISRHLGLPESHDFIYLFIATFPVILDTVFKYWIFRYLNRISPSAVATYRNMNE